MPTDELLAQSEVDRHWGKACAVIFGTEIGGISQYGGLLSRYISTPSKAKSFASGKDVFYSSPYGKGARFASFSESGMLPKPSPVNLNDIRDIGSLARSVSEAFVYSGDRLLGKSKFVGGSDNCIDSFYVLRSSEIFNCEYVAYCNYIRDSKYMFGCSTAGDSSFCINMSEFNGTVRSFESGLAFRSSDVFYSFYTRNCHNAIFCFNVSNRSYAIGNNELGKDRFGEIKGHLLEQMVSELKGKKSLPSLVEMVCHG